MFFELVLGVILKIIRESHIWNFVKHQRGSDSSKVSGVPLDDWANGGYVDDLLQVW